MSRRKSALLLLAFLWLAVLSNHVLARDERVSTRNDDACQALHALLSIPAPERADWVAACRQDESFSEEQRTKIRQSALTFVPLMDPTEASIVVSAFDWKQERAQAPIPSELADDQRCQAHLATLIRYEQPDLPPASTIVQEDGAELRTECPALASFQAGDRVLIAFVDRFGKSDSLEVVAGAPFGSAGASSTPEYHRVDSVRRIEGQKVYFVSLPRDAPYWARFREDESPLGILIGDASNQIRWFESRDRACFDLELALTDPKALVLVDGHLLTLRQDRTYRADKQHKIDAHRRLMFRIDLNESVHDLVVLSWKDSTPASSTNAVPHELLRTRFESQSSELRCQAATYDLRSLNRVALVAVQVDQRCQQAGLNHQQVQSQANATLRRMVGQEHFVDTQAVATFLSGVSGFNERVGVYRAFSGSGSGRGGQDTTALQAQLASEYLRQGIQIALSLDVQCTRFSEEQGWIYGFQAQALRLDAKERSEDPITGQKLPPIATETESTRDSTLLEYAMSTPLSRLLDKPYVRFSSPNVATTTRSDVDVQIDVFDPSEEGRADEPASKDDSTPTRVGLWWTRLNNDDAAQTCPPLHDHEKLSGQPWKLSDLDPESHTWDRSWLTASSERKSSGPRRTIISSFTPTAPGTYLVLVQKLGVAQQSDVRCVTVWARSPRFALTASHAVWESGRRETYSAVEVDYAVPVVASDVFRSSVGLTLGVSRSTYELSAPPSWSPEVDVATDGTLDLSWSKDAVFLAPYTDFRWQWGRLGLHVVPPLPRIAVGYISTAAIPRELNEFLGDSAGSRFDVDVSLVTRVGVGVHPPKVEALDLSAGVYGGILGADDYLARNVSTSSASVERVIEYDPSVIIGLFAEVGYSR